MTEPNDPYVDAGTDPNDPYGEDGTVTLDPNDIRHPDPAWGDVFAGLWDRLTNPLPPPT